MNLINEEECGIEGYNIHDGPKDVDTNFTSYIATLTKQKDVKFNTTLFSDAVKPSHQGPFECKKLTFPTSRSANKTYMTSKDIINHYTSPTSTELPNINCTENDEYS